MAQRKMAHNLPSLNERKDRSHNLNDYQSSNVSNSMNTPIRGIYNKGLSINNRKEPVGYDSRVDVEYGNMATNDQSQEVLHSSVPKQSSKVNLAIGGYYNR